MTSHALPPVFATPIRVSGLGLQLREWTEADLPAMSELFDEVEVARWTPLPSPFDLAAAGRYFSRLMERRALGFAVQFAVTTDGGAPLGEASVFRKGDDGRDVELGYAIGAAHRGQGLASRSMRLLTAFAYDSLGASRIVLRIEPENAASCAVARSTGFQLSGEPQQLVTDPDGSEVVLDLWQHIR